MTVKLTPTERTKQWVKNNPERARANVARYREANPEQALFRSAKNNAKRTGKVFTISVYDIHIPEYCPLLGCKLTFTQGAGRVSTNISIDRKDSKRGYTPENIWVVSDLANRMKQEATKEQLIAFAKGILKMYE